MKHLLRALYEDEDTGKWQSAWRRYEAELQKLLPGLTKDVRRFLEHEWLHDGTLISLSAGDAINRGAAELHLLNRNRRKLTVAMLVLTFEQDFLYTLTFREVRHLRVEYPTMDPREYEPMAFGDWLYSELTRASRGFLSFCIVFASGAEISLQFQGLRVAKVRVPHAAGPRFTSSRAKV
jgi:hypothetical protein